MLETRKDPENGTIQRKRVCGNEHRFVTVEVPVFTEDDRAELCAWMSRTRQRIETQQRLYGKVPEAVGLNYPKRKKKRADT